MDIEKAIKVLYGMLDLVVIVNKSCETEKEAVETAAEALKKQIPVPTDMSHCQCGEIIDNGWKYCPDCGQKLEVQNVD